jgi:hypothetical protein
MLSKLLGTANCKSGGGLEALERHPPPSAVKRLGRAFTAFSLNTYACRLFRWRQRVALIQTDSCRRPAQSLTYPRQLPVFEGSSHAQGLPRQPYETTLSCEYSGPRGRRGY